MFSWTPLICEAPVFPPEGYKEEVFPVGGNLARKKTPPRNEGLKETPFGVEKPGVVNPQIICEIYRGSPPYKGYVIKCPQGPPICRPNRATP